MVRGAEGPWILKQRTNGVITIIVGRSAIIIIE